MAENVVEGTSHGDVLTCVFRCESESLVLYSFDFVRQDVDICTELAKKVHFLVYIFVHRPVLLLYHYLACFSVAILLCVYWEFVFALLCSQLDGLQTSMCVLALHFLFHWTTLSGHSCFPDR